MAEKKRQLKVVCIGGGTGQGMLLKGLKEYTEDLTAIVTVTDCGRSTGVIREDFDMLAPGDVRNCLLSLSNSPELMNRLIDYRFEDGRLEGMSFGNLLIAALTKMTGDFDNAIKELSKILKLKGRVLPATLKNTQLCAELEDGKIVEGEYDVRGEKKPRIKRVFLKDPDAKAHPDCVKYIKDADIIVIGPGSLYTSVITNLLARGLSDAVKQSKAVKVYVNNIMTQPGQTDGYTTIEHVKEIVKYLGKGLLDYVILNNKRPPKDVLKRYKGFGADFLEPDIGGVEKLGVKVISADLIQKEFDEEGLWDKAEYIRHDISKITDLLISIVKPDIKALLLAAGKGTRLKPFSLTQSKEMIHILGKPVIAHHVDEFVRNNIEDFVVVCNDENLDEVKSYLEKSYPEQKFEFFVQKEQLGPSHAILSARKALKNSYFIVKYTDSLSAEDQIKKLVETYNSDRTVDAVITLRKVKDPKEYGIARFEKQKIVEIVEKPQSNFPSDLANVGICVLKGEKFFAAIDKIGFGDVLAPPDYILREKGKASYWTTDDKRVDLGRPWNILEANELLIKKLGRSIDSSKIDKSAEIEDSVFIGKDAKIGKGVKISGYSSVEGVIDDGTVIKDSVVMDGVSVGAKSVIERSVIGSDVKIGKKFVAKAGKNVEVYCKDKLVRAGNFGCFLGKGVVVKDNIKASAGRVVFPNKVVDKDIKEDRLVRAILFDADNTLYQTKKVAKPADMEAMKFFAKQSGKKAEELYSEWQKIVEKVVKEKDPKKRHRKYSYSILAKKNGFNYVDQAFNVFRKKVVASIKQMPNLSLSKLKDYKLAVFTEDSRDLAGPKLLKFGLLDKFDIIITSDDAKTMKPAKEYFDEVFERLDVPAPEAFVIGDNFEKDLKIPKKMGAKTVLIGKDIKDYSELMGVLDKV